MAAAKDKPTPPADGGEADASLQSPPPLAVPETLAELEAMVLRLYGKPAVAPSGLDASPLMPPEVASAVSAVMASVRSVEKNGRNDFHKYDFARVEDLLVKVQPAMVEAGLIIIQSEVCHGTMAEGKVATVTYAFGLFHKSGQGWASDAKLTGMAALFNHKGTVDDKAFNKCHTGARKYFLLSLLQVPTGDIPDVDDNTNTQEPPRQEARREPARPKPSEDDMVKNAKAQLDACDHPRDLSNWGVDNAHTYDDLSDENYAKITAYFKQRQSILDAQQKERA